MNSRIFALALIISTLVSCSTPSGNGEGANQDKLSRRAYSLAIHGGVGTITKANMTPEKEAAYTAALDTALEAERKESKTGDITDPARRDYKFGTVGCVALDKDGHLAAGTSTGGMTNKRWNRLGDAPVIGAGTYASDDACAVSCTGHGEYFIRYSVAHDVWARVTYLGETIEKATDYIVNKKLAENGGEGGLIAVDRYGNIAMPFNSEGMYRGFAIPGERKVMIYR